KITSTEFPSTGYYIMRNGWNKDDLYMIISAGISAEKPDHQHGDMLGIQAYAFGNMILPNYQVRYYLPDLEYFKNSWVKNVALVDSITQGQSWTGNKGGSGFGKFKKLPIPKIISWYKNTDIDIFTAEHNGCANLGVNYKRQVIFIKDGFWIVQDKFESNKEKRKFQQVWQGHYNEELAMQHYRSVFPNGAGLEILQLGDLPIKYSKGSARGKGNLIFESKDTAAFAYTTLLMPFKDFETRLKEPKDLNSIKIQEWQIEGSGKSEINNTDAQVKLSKNQQVLLIAASYFLNNINELKVITGKADLYINIDTNSWEVVNCGFENTEIKIQNQQKILKPGEKLVFNW
ncbi:MAG: heparinase II/III family protein, partial [Bacteroidales bacterium]|nr:heparinase II/III family protein [Bacteroidales bacterium]